MWKKSALSTCLCNSDEKNCTFVLCVLVRLPNLKKDPKTKRVSVLHFIENARSNWVETNRHNYKKKISDAFKSLTKNLEERTASESENTRNY